MGYVWRFVFCTIGVEKNYSYYRVSLHTLPNCSVLCLDLENAFNTTSYRSFFLCRTMRLRPPFIPYSRLLTWYIHVSLPCNISTRLTRRLCTSNYNRVYGTTACFLCGTIRNAMRGVRTHASRNGVVRLIQVPPESRYSNGTFCVYEFRASCIHCDHICVEGQDSPGV
jgi:hypothetical protein